MKNFNFIYLLLLCLLAPAETAFAQQAADPFVAQTIQRSEELLEKNPRSAYKLLKTKTDSLFAAENYMAFAKLFYYRANALLKYSDSHHAIDEMQQAEEMLREVDKLGEPHLYLLSDFGWLLNDLGQLKAATAKDSLALALRQKQTPVNGPALGKAWYNMGYNYLMMGDLQKSATYFNRALKEYRKHRETTPLQMMDAYNAIGSVNLHLEHTTEAEANFREALFFCDSVNDPETDKYRPSVQNNLGILYEDQGRLQEALDLFAQASTSCKSVLQRTDLADYERSRFLNLQSKIHSNTGAIYFEIGDYGKAERLYQLVLRERTKRLEPNHNDLNRIYSNLGRIYLQNGNQELSRQYFQKAINGCEKSFAPNSYWTALAYADMASVDVSAGDYENAHRWYNKALSLIEELETDEEVSAYNAQLFVHLAELYESEKNYPAAIKLSQQAYERYKTGRGANSPRCVQLAIQTGRLYLAQGNYEAAEKVLNQAESEIDLYTAKNGSEAAGEDLSIHHLIPQISYLKAKIALAKEPRNLRKALAIAEQGINALENSKRFYSGNDSKLLLYEANSSLFDLAENLSAHLYQSGKKEYLDTLLNLAEQNKAILIRQKLNSFRALQYSSIPDSLVKRERELASSLTKLPRQDSAMTEVAYTETYGEYLKLINFIRHNYPDYYDLQFSKSNVSAEQIQKELIPPDAALIYYIYSDSSLYAVVVNANSKQYFSLEVSDLEKNIASLMEAAENGDAEAYYQSGNLLYHQLIAPLVANLTDENLIIIPDGILHTLNFEALPKGRSGKGFEKMQYLISDYIISYYLSVDAALKYRRLKNSVNKEILAFAPEFTDSMKIAYRGMVTEKDPEFDGEYLTLLRQPFAANTADELQAQYAGLTFRNFEATEDNFKAKCGNYGIIHLGTHAELNATSPLLSRLVLAKSKSNDGYLHAYEIYNLPLRAELVVLTACQTGSGKINSGEGVISLAHSFAFAGCPSLIMSLWEIDEKITSAIIDDFYKNLSHGYSKSEALATAKRNYLETAQGDLANPIYWAGMVLTGNTDPVIPEKKFSPFYWWLGGAVLAVLLIMAIFRMRKPAGRPLKNRS